MAQDVICIGDAEVRPGEQANLALQIARLPSHTMIEIPVFVFRAKRPGARLLLTGSMHGDELNGLEIIRRMITQGLATPERGSVIAMPIVNVYGFLLTSRDLPDGKDLNRSFPGSMTGSLARRIAAKIMTDVLPNIDVGIDFHTGGARRANYAQIRCTFSDADSFRLARAFRAPFTIDAKRIPQSFRAAAHDAGKRVLTFETGESSRFDEFGIQQGVDGTLRLMRHLRMRGDAPKANRTCLLRELKWVRARSSGLFHSMVSAGQAVRESQVLAHITDPFGESEIVVKSPIAGYIVGVNNQPVVSQGDAVIHIGSA